MNTKRKSDVLEEIPEIKELQKRMKEEKNELMKLQQFLAQTKNKISLMETKLQATAKELSDFETSKSNNNTVPDDDKEINGEVEDELPFGFITV